MSYRRHNRNYHGNNDFIGCLIGLFLTLFITIISIIVELFKSGNRVAKMVATGIIVLLMIVYYLIKGGFSTAALVVFGIGTIVVMIILSLIPADVGHHNYSQNEVCNNDFYPEEDFCRYEYDDFYEHSFEECFGELESNIESIMDHID